MDVFSDFKMFSRTWLINFQVSFTSLLCLLIMGSIASAGSQDTLSFTWSRSLPIDWMSQKTEDIGGTETRTLVTFDSKLYAAIGYWSDSQEKNPNLPGAQVLVLESAKSQWKVDLELPEVVRSGENKGLRKYFAVSILSSLKFTRDKDGNSIDPVPVLIAGVWERAGGTEVFYKTLKSGKWTKAILEDESYGYNPVRSFTLYEDKITHVQRIFAGFGWKSRPGTYSGLYDSKNDCIIWDKTPESWEEDPSSKNHKDDARVTSFAECNGKLYATAYNRLYERQDGTAPVWEKVFEYSMNTDSGHGTGFRGLTTFTNPNGQGESLLLTVEDNPLKIFNVNPKANFESMVDLNVSEFLRRIWKTNVNYGIAAYNNMISYPYPSKESSSLLMGFEVSTPELDDAHRFYHWNADAHILLRHPDGSYSIMEIIDHSLSTKPKLVSTRTVVLSPFADDTPGTIYAGGWDCNYFPVHNTAWVYKGVPN